ncbi:DUF1127 domain-containing protein [Frigidibacter sp. MR17.24]|uniref:DUF1127 domain-containing protein n=1 Tax=Frigidibacter sp. MR17.24 TaxID=3127345 RepID=UPI003012AAF7
MTTLPISHGSAGNGAKTRIRGVGLVTRFRGWQAMRRQRAALAKLDGHLLQDIGLDHLEALRESGKAFWAE